jgi:lipoprotein-anchoring transpeptidase ErfK/SrfK
MLRFRTTCGLTLAGMPRGLATSAVVLLIAGCGGAEADRAAAPPRHIEPAPPDALSTSRQPPARRYVTAVITRRTALYARPDGRVLDRLKAHTEFGSQTVLGVIARRGEWLKVAAAQLPNGRRGWVRSRDTFLHGTDYDIRVDRSAHRAALRHDGRVLLRFPVAVGRPGNETPLGRYAVTDKLTPVESTSPYGCCALALTGHQTRLEPGWPGGDRLAIHGTPATWSIGQAVSLGCMRAPTKALHVLMRRVPLGAPVIVRA